MENTKDKELLKTIFVSNFKVVVKILGWLHPQYNITIKFFPKQSNMAKRNTKKIKVYPYLGKL